MQQANEKCYKLKKYQTEKYQTEKYQTIKQKLEIFWPVSAEDIADDVPKKKRFVYHKVWLINWYAIL